MNDNIGKKYCVYQHIFPNGKRYIGISCDYQHRWRKGKGYETQGKIHNAIKHFGWKNVKHEIIIEGLTKEQAQKAEKEFIQAYDSIENGYNTSVGGAAITSSYLNEHVLLMIRESKKIDKEKGYQQIPDDIVSLAEKAKYNKEDAEVFNTLDGLIQNKYCEYKRYKYRYGFFDGIDARIDCYWWTMLKLLTNTYPMNDSQPYLTEWSGKILKGVLHEK